MKFIATLIFGLLICCAHDTCAQQINPVYLAQGRDLLAHLSSPPSSDQVADKLLFQKAGFDAAEQDLLAVSTEDQRPSATRDDWPELHRTFAALIELNVLQDRLYQASIYANLQDASYRHNEADYTAALGAARQALDLQQRSGETATLYIPWKALGEDLLHLGQIDEGIGDLYQARSLVKNPSLFLAAELRYEIVSLESSRGNSAAAHKESAAFLADAGETAPPIVRAYALLAAANVTIGDLHFDDAIIDLHASLNAILHSTDRPRIADQIIAALMALGMEAMHTMPHDQALALCARLDAEFPHLPIAVSTFARQVSGTPPTASKSAKAGCDAKKVEKQIAATRLDLLPENAASLRATGREPEALREKLITLEAGLAQAQKQTDHASPCSP